MMADFIINFNIKKIPEILVFKFVIFQEILYGICSQGSVNMNKKVNYLPVAGLPMSDCISSAFDPYFFKYSSSSFSAKTDLLKYFLDGSYKKDLKINIQCSINQ